MANEKAPPGVDPLTPSVARMYDYFLGGKDYFSVDREAADAIDAISPDAKALARGNREFLGRVVRTLAGLGVRQFLDIGAGLPTRGNVHEVAAEHAPGSRTVYVDNDPIVLVHSRALLDGDEAAIAVAGDMRDPAEIVWDPEVRGHLDFERPIAVLLVSVLHFVDDDEEAGQIVRVLREALAPGSFLAISHITQGELTDSDADQGREIYSRATAAGLTFRDSAQITDLLCGFDVLEPGVTLLADWRPDGPAAQWSGRPESSAIGLGVVGRLPIGG